MIDIVLSLIAFSVMVICVALTIHFTYNWFLIKIGVLIFYGLGFFLSITQYYTNFFDILINFISVIAIFLLNFYSYLFIILMTVTLISVKTINKLGKRASNPKKIKPNQRDLGFIDDLVNEIYMEKFKNEQRKEEKEEETKK